MSTSIVKLLFTAPVHFGDGRLSDSEYSCGADTLFSALFTEAIAQGISDVLLDAAKSGSLLISDAFPWIENVYYLPKPRFAAEREDSDNAAQDILNSYNSSNEKKAFKDLKFIPEESYADFFDGSFKAREASGFFNNEIGKGELVTKVNLLRENREEAEPYGVGSFRFKEDEAGRPVSGLYFLVRGDFDIIPLLETLKYSGLGGKRSSGYGRFLYEIQDAEDFLAKAREAAPGDLDILLSSAAPSEEELCDELLCGAAYTLKKRAGFIQSSTYADSQLKKRDFYVFEAGSVFKKKFKGDVFDVSVRGNHPVWRCAKAFWLKG